MPSSFSAAWATEPPGATRRFICWAKPRCATVSAWLTSAVDATASSWMRPPSSFFLGHFHGGSPSVVRRRTAIVAQKRAGGARHACGGREREPNASRRMRPQVGGRAGWTARCAARWTARASARNAKEGGARAPCKLPAIFWPRNRVLARIEPVSAAWQLCRNRRPGLSPAQKSPSEAKGSGRRAGRRARTRFRGQKTKDFPHARPSGRSSRGAREGCACDRGRMWKRARGGRRAGGVTRST